MGKQKHQLPRRRSKSGDSVQAASSIKSAEDILAGLEAKVGVRPDKRKSAGTELNGSAGAEKNAAQENVEKMAEQPAVVLELADMPEPADVPEPVSGLEYAEKSDNSNNTDAALSGTEDEVQLAEEDAAQEENSDSENL